MSLRIWVTCGQPLGFLRSRLSRINSNSREITFHVETSRKTGNLLTQMRNISKGLELYTLALPLLEINAIGPSWNGGHVLHHRHDAVAIVFASNLQWSCVIHVDVHSTDTFMLYRLMACSISSYLGNSNACATSGFNTQHVCPKDFILIEVTIFFTIVVTMNIIIGPFFIVCISAPHFKN
ncbi:hypothetical protein GOBAR_DD24740 [Gossypium barbadense]|nr:hypothetical protein GOBAR_DD24740 [Gossypium barbadense]